MESFSLKDHSFMRIGGLGAFLIEVASESDFAEAVNFAHERDLPIHVLGAGSNSIFTESGLKKIFIKFTSNSILKIYENSDFANVQVDAGTNWDDFVNWTVEHNLAGIEALSLIPGTVGACPVQNIGAYGQEVSNTITNVRAYDTVQNCFFDFPNLECEFEYRNSIFKKNPGRFIITKVTFNLKKVDSKNFELKIPEYKDVQKYFDKKKKPTLKQIRNAIIEIRQNKLPDPAYFPNCGSFFENPIVNKFVMSKILMKHLDMPYFETKTADKNLNANELALVNNFKLYTGWLIENAGLKGHNFGKIKIDEKNALVLVNHNDASFADLIDAIEKIKSAILEQFNVELSVEPNLIE